MLPSSVDNQGKPYVDDRGKRRGEGGSLGNCGVGRQGANETTRVGTIMSADMKKKLVQFLKENIDIFAWSHEDMPSISIEIIQHKLDVDPKKKPIQ